MGCRNRTSSYKVGKYNSASRSKTSLSELARSLFCVTSQQTSGSHKSKLLLIRSLLGPCVHVFGVHRLTQVMEVMKVDGEFAPSEVPGGLSLHSARDFPVAVHLRSADCTTELKISMCSSGVRCLASLSAAAWMLSVKGPVTSEKFGFLASPCAALCLQ